MMKRIYTFILSLFVCISIAYAQDTIQHIIAGRVNRPNQLKKPYVILISADGFRYDLADKYQALIPSVKDLPYATAHGMAARRFGYWQKNRECSLQIFIGSDRKLPFREQDPPIVMILIT